MWFNLCNGFNRSVAITVAATVDKGATALDSGGFQSLSRDYRCCNHATHVLVAWCEQVSIAQSRLPLLQLLAPRWAWSLVPEGTFLREAPAINPF